MYNQQQPAVPPAMLGSFAGMQRLDTGETAQELEVAVQKVQLLARPEIRHVCRPAQQLLPPHASLRQALAGELWLRCSKQGYSKIWQVHCADVVTAAVLLQACRQPLRQSRYQPCAQHGPAWHKPQPTSKTSGKAPMNVTSLGPEARAKKAEEIGYRSIGAELPEGISLADVVKTMPKEVGAHAQHEQHRLCCIATGKQQRSQRVALSSVLPI